MDTWKYFPILCWKALQKWKALLLLVSVIRGAGSKPGIVLRFSRWTKHSSYLSSYRLPCTGNSSAGKGWAQDLVG